ncbi:MAG TPA: tRNA lysidine(34) synthetase TilS [Rectinemataceae bacterium]|nr:tRNA lysidine(34) synthetase TilS [Rectinemataceae bacterium]
MKGLSARDFESRIEAWFRRNGLSIDSKAIVAFSGGPDSTALLAALQTLGAGPLRAVHIDHGIREPEERRKEALLVARNAEGLGVELEMRRVEEGRVMALAKERGIGIEAAARFFRRKELFDAKLAFGAEWIYVGHSRDDDLEGLLMRFMGGSGSSGLRGLRPLAAPLGRPLLDLSRAEILAYLESRNIVPSLDSTNGDTSILRNKVRAELVPLLDGDFRGWRSGLMRTARRLAVDDDAIESLLHLVPIIGEGPELVIDYGSFASLPAAARFRLLAQSINRLVKAGKIGEFPGTRLPARMLERALTALEEGRAFAGHGISIVREGNLLKVSPSLDFGGSAGYFVALNESDIGIERPSPDGGRLTMAWTNGPDSEGIPDGNFDFPLILRTRRPGDQIALVSGPKTVDRIVAAWKAGSRGWQSIAVVQDRRGIVAVLGRNGSEGRAVFRFQEPRADVRRRLFLRLKGA